MKATLPSLALLFAKALALSEGDSPSYYGSADAFTTVKGVEPEPQELYYNYVYGEYYNSGQTVAAIIFLDIVLPIACCVGIICAIVCIIRASQRRRAHELAHHQQIAHDQHHEHMMHHGEGGATVTQVHYQQPGVVYQQQPMMGQPMMGQPMQGQPMGQPQYAPQNPYAGQMGGQPAYSPVPMQDPNAMAQQQMPQQQMPQQEMPQQQMPQQQMDPNAMAQQQQMVQPGQTAPDGTQQ